MTIAAGPLAQQGPALPSLLGSISGDLSHGTTPAAALHAPKQGSHERTAVALKRGEPDIIIERLGPRCAIGTDGRQWIVFKASGGATLDWDGQQWQAVAYIHSDKRALLNCLKVKGLELSPEGQAALDRQDPKIFRWRKS